MSVRQSGMPGVWYFSLLVLLVLCPPFPAMAEILLFGDLTGVVREPRQVQSSLPRSEVEPRSTLFYSGNLGRVTALAEFVVDKERSQFGRVKAGWSFDGGANLWLGRFHNPASHWRDQYHHGGYLQPTIVRPGVAEFEGPGGILPAHTTGIQLEGEKLFADRSLGYVLGLGYGGELEEGGLEVPELLEDERGLHNVTVAGRLSWHPDILNDDALGAFFSLNHIASHVGEVEEIEQWLAGGFLSWGFAKLTLSGEFYLVGSRPRTVGSRGWDRFSSGYLQLIYQLDERWSLNARVEDTFDFRNDFYLDHFPQFVNRRRLLGGRYELGSNQALKLELAEERRQSAEAHGYLALQWSIVLP